MPLKMSTIHFKSNFTNWVFTTIWVLEFFLSFSFWFSLSLPPIRVIAGERRVGEVEDSIGGMNGDGKK